MATPDAPTQFTVSGTVVNTEGIPMPNYFVRAFDKNLTQLTAMGSESTTDANGRYSISYTSSNFGDQTKSYPDLVVKVFNESGVELRKSPVILKAQGEEEVNLVTGSGTFQGVREYAVVLNRIGEQAPAEFIDSFQGTEQAADLASKNELGVRQVNSFIQARKLNTKLGVSNEEMLFALVDQGLGTTASDLLMAPKSELVQAVKNAADSNRISAVSDTAINNFVAQVKLLAVSEALAENEGDSTDLNEYISAAGLGESASTFVQHIIDYEDGDAATFWSSLSLEPTQVGQLRAMAELVSLSGNTQFGKFFYEEHEPSGVIDLVGWELNDFVMIIQDSGDMIPDEIEGTTMDERRLNYAATMRNKVEATYPTQVFARRMSSSTTGINQADDFNTFFVDNPNFQFDEMPVHQYLDENVEAMRSFPEPTAMIDNLKAMQRLVQITPQYDKYEAIEPIWKGGIRSAMDIQRMGKAAFMEAYETDLGHDAAVHMYTRASQRSAMVMTYLSNFGAEFNSIQLPVIGNYEFVAGDSVAGLPSMETLFGSLDQCSCEHCRSVYSAAAYLVDLLQWLKEVQVGGTNLRDKLFQRREEIQYILLNCENTNTPLPYIDLVLEVLENEVSAATSLPGYSAPSFNRQTTLEANALKAHPEHLREVVYSLLKIEIYPWKSPFHLWETEAHVYLEHLGISYAQLLTELPSGSTPTAIDVACKVLKINPLERYLFTDSVSDMQNYINANNGTAGAPTLTFTSITGGISYASVVNVRTFLDMSGLIFDELTDLLEVRYITVNNGHITYDSADNCDLTLASLNLTQDEIRKLNRFVRLQRKLGWSAEELDIALHAVAQALGLSGPDITDAVLVELAGLYQLQQTFQVPIPSLTAWYGALDTNEYHGETDVFTRLFVNPAVNDPDEAIPGLGISIRALFTLNATRTDIDTPQSIYNSEVTPFVLAGANLVEEELELLLPSSGSPTTTLANLSYLYRVSSFCKTMGITVSDFLILQSISGITPVSTNGSTTTVDKTEAFSELLDTLGSSALNAEMLDYVLRDVSVPNSIIPLNEGTLSDTLTTLRSELVTARENLKIEGSNGRELIIQQLQLFVDFDLPSGAISQADMDGLIAVIDDITELGDTEANTLIDTVLADLYTPTERNDIKGYVVTGGGSINAEMLQQRYITCFPGLQAKIDSLLWPAVREQLILDELSAYFGVEATLMLGFLKTHLTQIGGSDPIIDLLSNDSSFANTTNAINDTNFATLFQNLRLVYKNTLLAVALRWKAEDLPYLFQSTSSTGLFDLNALHSSSITTTQFNDWMKIVRVSQLNSSFSGELRLLQILDNTLNGSGANEATTLQEVEDLTRWSDLAWLAGSNGFDFVTADSQYYRKTDWLQTVKDAVVLTQRSGVKAETLASWAVTEMTVVQTHAIINTSKSKYGYEKWYSVAAPLRDELRKQQRDALVDYMIQNPPSGETFKDAYSLYEYYLIDPEMDPCRMTSRVKQANSTIQLFVQRVIMNLEQHSGSPIVMPKTHVKEWEWRKNYRVWEANRKVFLYPENWLEPELRDDKTNFFQEMWDELQERDITMDTATDAFLTYVGKVDEVADLEIAQMCYDEGYDVTPTNDLTTLHVFARTKSTPHVYYYRKWVDDAYWTHWEKIDMEIEGDHLMPIVYNNRLMLFWPSYLEKADAPSGSLSADTTANTVSGKNPIRKLEIYLNWTEFKHGKWLKQKRSKAAIDTFNLDKRRHRFSARIRNTDNALTVAYFYDSGTNNGNQVFAPGESCWLFDGCSKEPRITAEPFQICDSYMCFWDNASSIYQRNDYEKWVARKQDLPFSVNSWIARERYHYTNWWSYSSRSNETRNVELLRKAESNEYRLTFPNGTDGMNHQNVHGNYHFFYEDEKRSFFVQPEEEEVKVFESVLYNLRETVGVALPLYGTDNSIVYESRLPEESAFTLGGTAPLDNARFYTLEDEDRAIEVSDNVTLDWGTSDLLPISTTRLAEKHTRFKYRFYSFYHNYLCLITKQLNRYGVEGLLSPEPGRTAEDGMLDRQSVSEDFFVSKYDPTGNVLTPYPANDIDFLMGAGYGIYNWELFFHAPLMVACELSKNQKFKEAQKWFHFIFDPTETTGSSPERFWRTKPFHEFNGETSIQQLVRMLNDGDAEMQKQVGVWRKNPFMPHAIARLRWVAYMKNVVMKYLDNLIAWGDNLFTRDTIESVNEATQVYLMAAQILGRRPDIVERGGATATDYDSIKDELDDFSNAMVALEDIGPNTYGGTFTLGDESMTSVEALYFCIPKNEKLWGYWDIVADRLFKIRHCLNIEGVFRQLPLFEPPIDPGMLVKAAASGLSIADALSDMSAPLPYYKFQYLHQKAVDLVNDVKSLGGTLLSVLEKKDSEELSLLRSDHEISVMKTLENIRKQSIEEAEMNIEGLKGTLEVVKDRQRYYAGRPYQINREKVQLDSLKKANTFRDTAAVMDSIAAVLAIIPQIDLGASGFGGSPIIKAEIGGIQLGEAMKLASGILNTLAGIQSGKSNMASVMAGHDRRMDDWKFQAANAKLEIAQVEKQIQAAEIRKALAEKELENQQLQLENAKEAKAFMEDKFTNKELYGWMVKEVSKLYFAAYKLAFDMAKKAEKAYKYEIGIDDPTQYIQFGYWDSLRKGLLAGERLHQDLKRLDIAHTDRNRREHELTKHVSLALVDPQALVKLRETGKADFDIPEILYDLDHPGHYMRRIKSVSLTIPCVTGPYTTVNAKLTLLGNRIRKNTALAGSGSTDYAIQVDPAGDSRFIYNITGIESIATSNGQNDSGLFELNFNDNRYLPFEGAGAISSWRIEFPNTQLAGSIEEFRQFDYGTISDVIVTVRYMARDGGDSFRQKAQEYIQGSINSVLDEQAQANDGLWRAISMKREFPTELYTLLNEDVSGVHSTSLTLSDRHFPQVFRNKDLQTLKAVLVVVPKKGVVAGLTSNSLELHYDVSGTWTQFHSATTPAQPAPTNEDGDWGGTGTIEATRPSGQTQAVKQAWRIQIDESNVTGVTIDGTNLFDGTTFNQDLIEDIYLAFRYTKV